MYGEQIYCNDLLLEEKFFSGEERELARKILVDGRVKEYSVLNEKVKELGFASMYRIRSERYRLFGIKTKKGNIYWFAIIIPKGGKHDPLSDYWPKLAPKAGNLLEWLKDNPEPDRPILSEVQAAKADEPTAAVIKIEIDIESATPLQAVRYWVGKINTATRFCVQNFYSKENGGNL